MRIIVRLILLSALVLPAAGCAYVHYGQQGPLAILQGQAKGMPMSDNELPGGTAYWAAPGPNGWHPNFAQITLGPVR